MLIIVGSDPFFTWFFIVSSAAAANEIAPALSNSLLVNGECADEDEQLEDKVSNDTKSSDKAEVSQGWNIS